MAAAALGLTDRSQSAAQVLYWIAAGQASLGLLPCALDQRLQQSFESVYLVLEARRYVVVLGCHLRPGEVVGSAFKLIGD